LSKLALLAVLAFGGAFVITFNRESTAGHALLNTESFVALAFLLLVFLRSRPAQIGARDREPNRHLIVALALCAIVATAYWNILNAPFLYDDYTHITDATNSTLRTVLSAFGPVEHKPGLFFRPFGFFIYWLNFLWAGDHSRWWHVSSLVLHAASCLLLFALCRELRMNWIGSLAAALLFALNASSAEAISWIDARFDPMTTSLVLGSLLCFCRFLESERRVWMLWALVIATCAMCSKESAFCLPILAACLWFFRPESDSPDQRRRWTGCAWFAALAVALFAYRWWALGGVGGYRTSPGQVDLSRFHPIHTLNALVLREWAILFFPLNWSAPPGLLLRIFLISIPIVSAACAWWARIPRRVFLGCIALTLAAALPVQHLLLIDTDLSGSRIVYLLSVGWAILWGNLFSAIPRTHWRVLAIAWALALQALMLHHNLAEWTTIPVQARNACVAFAQTVKSTSGPVVVSGLPSKKRGVVFLHGGFPECVQVNGGPPLGRIQVVDGPGANYTWNDSSGRIEPVR
jgi:Dolichyl-phosphate-mannose-protein mannosyltransferase